MKKILVGQITSPHGVKGMVKVYPYTDNAERFLEIEGIYLDGSGDFLKIQSVSFQKKLVILKLETIDDRNIAERLRDVKVYIDIDDRKELKEDEYFVDDLIGLSVYDSKNERYIGKVNDFISQVGNDILVITTEEGEFMVPFVKAFIKDLSIENSKIMVELIEGMLP